MPNFQLDSAQLDILQMDGTPYSSNAPSDDTWYSTNGVYFGFQNANVISQFFRESNPTPQIATRQLPRTDGQFAEVRRYQETTISIQGTIQSDSRANMEAILDTLKKVCSPLLKNGGTLKLNLAGAARYWDKCYPTAEIGKIFEGRDFYHLIYCPFKVSFSSYQPFGRLAARAGNSPAAAMTASSTILAVPNDGTASSDLVATLTVITAGTISSLTITNNATAEYITITKSFSNGDVIEIDGENKLVTVNGTNVDFTGIFQKVAAGGTDFTVAFGGAGYSVAATLQAYPRFY